MRSMCIEISTIFYLTLFICTLDLVSLCFSRKMIKIDLNEVTLQHGRSISLERPCLQAQIFFVCFILRLQHGHGVHRLLDLLQDK